MATNFLSNFAMGHKLIDKRTVPVSPTSPITSTFSNAMRDLTALDAALVTLNAGYWTQARLDATCVTDKTHALRLGTDAAGIS